MKNPGNKIIKLFSKTACAALACAVLSSSFAGCSLKEAEAGEASVEIPSAVPEVTAIPDPTALTPVTETPGPTSRATAEPTPEPTPAPTPEPTPEPLPEGYMTEEERIRLVNFEHRLPKDYVPHDMVTACQYLKGECGFKYTTTQIQIEVADHLREMLHAAKAEGVAHDYYLVNAYRDQYTQWNMWRKRLASNPHYGDDPYGHPVGTMPGDASEHCSGLAIDITSMNYTYVYTGYGTTAEAKWMKDNAHRFGFILRYPADKEHITGVHYEPWHFRYVGVEAATEIWERGLCLEEYLGMLPPYMAPDPTPAPTIVPKPTEYPSFTGDE